MKFIRDLATMRDELQEGLRLTVEQERAYHDEGRVLRTFKAYHEGLDDEERRLARQVFVEWFEREEQVRWFVASVMVRTFRIQEAVEPLRRLLPELWSRSDLGSIVKRGFVESVLDDLE